MSTDRGKRNCEEDSEMNFAAFSTAGSTGTHFVTTSGQVPVAKLPQGVPNNAGLQQVVGMVGGMGEGVQYVRAIDGSGALQTPQLISLPITLPGAKPGDPQQTVQIQVLSPNLTLQPQQQAKYQMQIPIQSFQQGGAVLTVAYSQDPNETGGIQLLGNALPEGIQVLTALPQEMQLIQSQPDDSKEHLQQTLQQHQVFITPNNQIIINGEQKPNVDVENNNAISNMTNIIIKEECDDNNDDESSQGTEPDAGDGVSWQLANSQQELIKYLNTLPPQQVQSLPVSLQQFLRLNPADSKKGIELIEVQVQDDQPPPAPAAAEAVLTEDGLLKITQCKKKKKYKKKAVKPARPKPGQVVIATDAEGAPIYCCPECQMAYPEKEHLEMHLAVHKIERRFICGICGAGLKRKEHLERHKLGHNPERPYVCGVCRKGFKRREHLNLHTVIHSGVKTELCLECGKGFYRKDHLRKHTRSHESRRAREEAQSEEKPGVVQQRATATNNPSPVSNPNPVANVMPEITIHVPTSGQMGVPVQINIPQHMVSSLQSSTDPLHLDTILADHT